MVTDPYAHRWQARILHDGILRHSCRCLQRVTSGIVILPNDGMGCAKRNTSLIAYLPVRVWYSKPMARFLTRKGRC
jgi:hypothetical protein